METAICKTSDQIPEEILISIPETKGFHTPTETMTPRGGSPLKDINSDLKIIGQKVNGHSNVETNKNDEFPKPENTFAQKSVSPTLIEHAFKVVKNLFSPEKVRSNTSNILNSISPKRSPPISPCSSIYIPNPPNFYTPESETGNTSRDHLGINQLGSIRTSLNTTNDSYLTAVSLMDESFQSTVTDLDGHNRDGVQSGNITLLDGSGISESYLENTLLKNSSFVIENKSHNTSHEESLNETQVRNINAGENGVNGIESEGSLPNGNIKSNGEINNVENLFLNSSFNNEEKSVKEKECEAENDIINIKKVENDIDFLRNDRENIEKSISTTTVVLSNADSNEFQGLMLSLKAGESFSSNSLSSFEDSPGVLDCNTKLSHVKNGSKSEGNSPNHMSNSGKSKLNKSVDYIYSNKSQKGKQRKPVRSSNEIFLKKNEEIMKNNVFTGSVNNVRDETIGNIKSEKKTGCNNLDIENNELDFVPDKSNAIVSQQSYTILHNSLNATISRPVISSQYPEISQFQQNFSGDSPDVNKVVTPKQSTPISNGGKSPKKASKNSKGQNKPNPLNMTLDLKSNGEKIKNLDSIDAVGQKTQMFTNEEHAEFSPVVPINDGLLLMDSETSSPARDINDTLVVLSNESFDKKNRSPKNFSKKIKSPVGEVNIKPGSPKRFLRDIKAEALKLDETFDKPSEDTQVQFNQTFDAGFPDILNSTYKSKCMVNNAHSTNQSFDKRMIVIEYPVLNRTFDKQSSSVNSDQGEVVLSKAENSDQMNHDFDKILSFHDQQNQSSESNSNKQKSGILNQTFDKTLINSELEQLGKNLDEKLVLDKKSGISASNNLNQTFDINSGAVEPTKLSQTFEKSPNSQKSIQLNQTFNKKSLSPDPQELNENFDRKSDTSDYMTDSLEKELESLSPKIKSDSKSSNDANHTFLKNSDAVNSNKLNQAFENSTDALNPLDLASAKMIIDGCKLNQTFNKAPGISDSHQLNQTYDKESSPHNSFSMNQTFDKKLGISKEQELNQTYSKSEEMAPQFNETFEIKFQLNQTFERKPSRLSQTLEKVTEEVTHTEDPEVQKLFELKKGTSLHKSRKFNLTFDKDDGVELKDAKQEPLPGPEMNGLRTENEINPLNESFLSTMSSNTSFTSNETVIVNTGQFLSNDVDGLTENKADNFMWLDVPGAGCLDLGDAGKVTLEDLSPTVKDDKIQCDNELAELIQQQFSNSDIEKICTVVDDISSQKLTNQIIRSSEQFDKSFHESLIREKTISITSQNLDYFNSIGGQQGGRDLSRVSLYVKFDPLVQSPKSLIDFTKEAQVLAAIDSPPHNISSEQRPLLDLSPQKKREEIGPLTPISNKNSLKDDKVIIKELQNEIYFLKNLYAEKEKANKVRLEEYETQIAMLKEKLKESCNKFKEIENLRVIIDESFNIISKLTAELETTKTENTKKIEALTGERDLYMSHLQSTEAAFIHVLGKYEKCKKTIVQLKANEGTYKKVIAEQSQKLKESKERAREAQEKAFAEFQKIQEELNETETNHHREMARIRAQIRKTELKLEDLQE